MSEVNYEVIEVLGVVERKENGWTTQLTRIRWNDGPIKYDLRQWTPSGEPKGKGLTLTEECIENLREVLNGVAD